MAAPCLWRPPWPQLRLTSAAEAHRFAAELDPAAAPTPVDYPAGHTTNPRHEYVAGVILSFKAL